MKWRLLWVASLLCLAACQSAPSHPGNELRYELVDLTDDYARFWDTTQTLTERDRVAAFKTEFGALLPDFYGEARFAKTGPEKVDRRIARSFEEFPAIREEYTRTATAFESLMRPALGTFKTAFPDMQQMPTVYLLHSLGEMDGGTREIGGRRVLVFGADVMARVHDFEDEEPFLHHELFHIYHQRYAPRCDAVWCALWTEGLAVYVAHRLNPEASDSQLLLTAPEPIRPQVDAHLQEAVCAAKSRLDSTESADTRALFSFDRLSPQIPPRAGYYIGYLAARELGRSRPLVEMTQLPPEEVRALVPEALDALAVCP